MCVDQDSPQKIFVENTASAEKICALYFCFADAHLHSRCLFCGTVCRVEVQ